MNNTTLYIKNMVCYRCIMVVEDLLAKLGFTPLHVELGKLSYRKLSEKPNWNISGKRYSLWDLN